MVTISGTVHSVAPGNAAAEVEHQGRRVSATVPVIIVEVVGQSRSWTFDLHPDDAEALGITEGEDLVLTLNKGA